MAQLKSIFVCQNCGYETKKWYGKCPGCGEWNTLVEEIRENDKQSAVKAKTLSQNVRINKISEISMEGESRYLSGMKEVDRVLGGGIVKGSLILLGGEPGIGKSTLVLQICKSLSSQGNVLYISGEESQRQIKLRANRLGVNSENLYIMTSTDLESSIEQIKALKPSFVIVDSIQTMHNAEMASAPGSVSQVRECTNALMLLAKSMDTSIFIIGHVNKDGAIAGPKVLEHIVDTVLYFEGERHLSYRILRSVKNRYGSTNEIGVFEMQSEGLIEVENPSLMLLSGRPVGVSGTCVACIIEGSRPILAEVQALVTPTSFGNPRRMATGFDYNRISVLLALLEKRAGYFFSNQDVYVNVVGGLRLDEPAADLSVALALVSSLKDVPVADNIIAFGEVGLAGEIRSVTNAEERITEAARLGFKQCILPFNNLKKLKEKDYGIDLIGVKNVRQAFNAIIG